ncbi:MAG: class I SAM-dependent methyltransferase [Candidatus Eremiobacteraeota bacterium]|nr:class I SAM-dependent methyltransferase [Candidatus Eremiobacteraeota bacterium]
MNQTVANDRTLVRLYLDSERKLRALRGSRLGRLAYAAYEGAWLGTFDRSRLNAVTNAFYAQSGDRYVDEAYNASGLTEWERAAVERHFGECRTVLVTAAGGGREVFGLASLGFDVTAFECAPHLVAWSRTFLSGRGVNATLLAAEPDEVPPLGQFDGVVVGWGSYMHVAGRAARIAFLRRLRESLAPGAPLLVSFKALGAPRPERRAVVAVANVVRRLRGRDAAEIGDELKGWFRHCFTRVQIEDELRSAGFSPAAYAEEPYGHAVGIAV